MEERPTPHIPVAYEMYHKGPNGVVPHLWYHVPEAFADAYILQAVYKVVAEGWSIDEAASWGLKTWDDYTDQYQKEVSS